MYYKYITIEGNIGSGKTVLSSMLAKDYNARLILEEFDDNPFLPKFYEDPDKHAFPLELFFMAERYHQLKSFKDQDLFAPQIFSDYFFIKSRLFAQNNLRKDEMQLFNRLFDIMFSSLPNPDLLVYLYADIERLQQNIRKRGREFEQNISNDYLQAIQDKYLDYLRKQKDFPVLILDVTKVDFVLEKDTYNRIKDALTHSYNKGLNRIVL